MRILFSKIYFLLVHLSYATIEKTYNNYDVGFMKYRFPKSYIYSKHNNNGGFVRIIFNCACVMAWVYGKLGDLFSNLKPL